MTLVGLFAAIDAGDAARVAAAMNHELINAVDEVSCCG
jgi:hypothetical protein